MARISGYFGLACLLLAVSSRPCFAADYYVAVIGNNGASGDIDHPWSSLALATSRLLPGDNLYVEPGSYSGFVMYNGGAADQRITIKALGAVSINHSGTFGDGIDLEGASYVTIDGFTCDGRTRAGIRSVTNDGVIIRNNTCDSNGSWGILTGFSQNILIENNVCSHSVAEHGIYFSNSADNAVIRDNVCFGNSCAGIQINADASAGGDGITTGALIEDNICYNNGVVGGSAINLDGVQSSVIRNNLIYDNYAGGLVLYKGNAAAGPKNDLVENNTIIQAAGSRWDVNVGNAVGPVTLRNNILYHPGDKGSIETADAASTVQLTSDYNVVVDRFAMSLEYNVTPLAGWRGGTGEDLHSILVNNSNIASLFANFAGKDFHLAPGSLAIDAGAAIGSANDLNGRLRPIGDGYDIGAYEYTLAGDINCDGKVTFADYLVLESNFGKSGQRWMQGDLNSDGKVSFADYLILESTFGQSLPEPATLALLAVGLTPLRRHRKSNT